MLRIDPKVAADLSKWARRQTSFGPKASMPWAAGDPVCVWCGGKRQIGLAICGHCKDRPVPESIPSRPEREGPTVQEREYRFSQKMRIALSGCDDNQVRLLWRAFGVADHGDLLFLPVDFGIVEAVSARDSKGLNAKVVAERRLKSDCRRAVLNSQAAYDAFRLAKGYGPGMGTARSMPQRDLGEWLCSLVKLRTSKAETVHLEASTGVKKSDAAVIILQIQRGTESEVASAIMAAGFECDGVLIERDLAKLVLNVTELEGYLNSDRRTIIQRLKDLGIPTRKGLKNATLVTTESLRKWPEALIAIASKLTPVEMRA